MHRPKKIKALFILSVLLLFSLMVWFFVFYSNACQTELDRLRDGDVEALHIRWNVLQDQDSFKGSRSIVLSNAWVIDDVAVIDEFKESLIEIECKNGWKLLKYFCASVGVIKILYSDGSQSEILVSEYCFFWGRERTADRVFFSHGLSLFLQELLNSNEWEGELHQPEGIWRNLKGSL